MRAALCASIACCLAACASTPKPVAKELPVTLLEIQQCNKVLGVGVTMKDGTIEVFQDVDPQDILAVATQLPDKSVGSLVLPCDEPSP